MLSIIYHSVFYYTILYHTIHSLAMRDGSGSTASISTQSQPRASHVASASCGDCSKNTLTRPRKHVHHLNIVHTYIHAYIHTVPRLLCTFHSRCSQCMKKPNPNAASSIILFCFTSCIYCFLMRCLLVLSAAWMPYPPRRRYHPPRRRLACVSLIAWYRLARLSGRGLFLPACPSALWSCFQPGDLPEEYAINARENLMQHA